MFRRKAEKRIVELTPDEVRLMREALLAFPFRMRSIIGQRSIHMI